MLSVKQIENAAETERYFFESDNYYLKGVPNIEQVSSWFGEGAKQLNLQGAIDRQTFRQLLDGKMPDGSVLGRFRNGEREHRAGYDLTFAAPKSVSILSEICQDTAIHVVHEIAVNATLKLIEQECAQVRIWIDGKTEFVNTENLIIVKIRHDVSRALDAHLHTHCVVMNATLRVDDKWLSLARQNYKTKNGAIKIRRYQNCIIMFLVKQIDNTQNEKTFYT